jgi:hypothetical protein
VDPTDPRDLAAHHTRFPVEVDSALRAAGWEPGRWDIRQAESWADALRAHVSPGGHEHAVFPAAVEAWAEFGGLRVVGEGPGRQLGPADLHVDPMHGLHLTRTLADLGRALQTELCPLGAELAPDGSTAQAVLAVDADGRGYALDHTGDWFLGRSVDETLVTLVTGLAPQRLTPEAG